MINYHYKAYGLKIKSEIILPELDLEKYPNNFDILICYRYINSNKINIIKEFNLTDNTKAISASNGLYLIWNGIPICLIRDGKSIIINESTGLDESFIVFFILGYSMAILLHQRGMLVLHGNAVKIKDSAIALLGPSGSGKSTTSLILNNMGYDLIADDILSIDLFGKFPKVFSGYPRVKIWSDVIENMGKDINSIPQVHSNFPKLSYKINKLYSDKKSPLKSIYILEPSKKTEIRELNIQEALWNLVKNTYNIKIFDDDELRSNLDQCAKLASSIPIKSLKLVHSLQNTSEIIKILEDDLYLNL